jgi:hypothetical protein
MSAEVSLMSSVSAAVTTAELQPTLISELPTDLNSTDPERTSDRRHRRLPRRQQGYGSRRDTGIDVAGLCGVTTLEVK